MKIVKMVDVTEENLEEVVSFFFFSFCVRIFCANILRVYSMNIRHNEIYLSILASFTFAYQSNSIEAR